MTEKKFPCQPATVEGRKDDPYNAKWTEQNDGYGLCYSTGWPCSVCRTGTLEIDYVDVWCQKCSYNPASDGFELTWGDDND